MVAELKDWREVEGLHPWHEQALESPCNRFRLVKFKRHYARPWAILIVGLGPHKTSEWAQSRQGTRIMFKHVQNAYRVILNGRAKTFQQHEGNQPLAQYA